MNFDPMEDRLSFVESEYENLKEAMLWMTKAYESMLTAVQAMHTELQALHDEEKLHHEVLVHHQDILEIYRVALNELGHNL